ncbi:MAG TPA: DUF1631 family protein [Burkholderiales bacterium]|nr:DUF1631 family protein [Burkholderiales bacterium]
MSAAATLDRGSVLIQCRAAAEKHLGGELQQLLDALAPKLSDTGQHSRDREEREQYLRAAQSLFHEREQFLPAFRKEFAARFEERVRALQGKGMLARDLDRGELQALKTNVLENEAAIGRLSSRLKEHAGAELGELSARFATLFRHPAINDGDNPLGPLTIARAVFAGFAAVKIEGRVLRAVRQELEQRLAQPVLDVYRAVNKALGGLGVAAAVSRSAPGAATTPASPAGASPAASSPPAAKSPDAEAVAARAVETELAGASLPPAVEIFVRQSWHGVLVRAHAGGGAEGASWQEAVGTLRELLWSLRPRLEAGERARLVTLLPPLLKKVTLGMDAVMLDPESRKAVLDALMAHHRELLHGQPAARQG